LYHVYINNNYSRKNNEQLKKSSLLSRPTNAPKKTHTHKFNVADGKILDC